MKASVFLLIAFAVFAFTEHATAVLDEWFDNCAKSYGHTKESISKLPESERSCALQICLMRNFGLINKDNSLNVNYLLERRKSHVSESKIHDTVKTCDAESLGTLEKACKAVKCLMDSLPESGFNSKPNVTD
uniref:Odorant-binding protein n=1 Tax=Pteromalus puparum TaxID=32389 RepID=A0A0H3VBZ2_9HYME|nr:odorant-binding protein [Pteromalus puparum]